MLGRFFRRGKVRPGFFFPRGKIYTGILFPGVILSRGGFSGEKVYAGGNSMLQHRLIPKIVFHSHNHFCRQTMEVNHRQILIFATMQLYMHILSICHSFCTNGFHKMRIVCRHATSNSLHKKSKNGIVNWD